MTNEQWDIILVVLIIVVVLIVGLWILRLILKALKEDE